MTVTRVLHCVPQFDGASGEGDAVLLNGYIVSHDPRVQAQGRRGIGPDPKTLILAKGFARRGPGALCG